MKVKKRYSRGWLGVYLPAGLVTLLGFVVAYQFVDPAPPDRIIIATGKEDGAYFAYARAYREFLAKHGIELVVRTTAGSVENIRLLTNPTEDVELAFVQGGVAPARPAANADSDPTQELVALGSLYFEPLWVFVRHPGEASAAPTVSDSNNTDASAKPSAFRPGRLSALAGRRVAIGPTGSGTQAVARTLLAANGLLAISAAQPNPTLKPVKVVDLGGTAAADALRDGAVDAIFLIASVESPSVQRLLRADGVTALSFDRADAYERRYRFLSKLTLPEGSVDLTANIPRHDITMLAPAATLVANERLHPALIDLFLQAADDVHGAGGIFEENGQFPSPELIEYPLSDEARRFYRSGAPFLQRFMPFWAATLVDRLLVMLVPLIALLVPLARALPPIYRWRIRSRLTRWYRELLSVDPESADSNDTTREQRLGELRRIESEVAKVDVPPSFADQFYQLKAHIRLVRSHLEIVDPASETTLPNPLALN